MLSSQLESKSSCGHGTLSVGDFYAYLPMTAGLPCWLRVKSPPAMQETQVQPLGWEDPLEEEMATHCIILAWRIPWTEEPGGL